MYKKILNLFIAVLAVLLGSNASYAKGAEGQDQIVLLNDCASALEDSNPGLSRSLAKFADEKEKEWEKNNANNSTTPPPSTIQDFALIREHIKLLKEASIAMQTAYPLITKSLDQMIKKLQKDDNEFHGAFVGMSQGDFLDIYPQNKIRDLRHDGVDDWLTYNEPMDDPFHQVVTFYFQDQKLVQWKVDDRPEVIKEYLGEFCFYQPPTLTYQAIQDVLLRMPYNDFLHVTNRQRPVIFTEFYVEGTARFASSSEFIVSKDDSPCCKEGFTLVKLGMSLGLAKTPGPIEGVVAHEIAHRVLDTIRKGNVNCDAERAANRLIRQWGFTQEFKEASQLFGQKREIPPHVRNQQSRASNREYPCSLPRGRA